MAEIRNEILSKFNDYHNKYVYYLLSLSVAGIGFGIQNTSTYHNKEVLLLIVWCISILCWSTSVIFGFLVLESKMDSIVMDITKIDFINEEMEKRPSRNVYNYINELFDEKYKIVQRVAHTRFSFQKWLFLFGCLFYVIFHLIKVLNS